MNTYRILLVDDDIDFANYFETILNEINFKITTVSNGILALNILKKNKFDLIFLDMKMPYMNGENFLLKLENSFNKNKIVMLTGDNSKESFLKIKNLGIQNYLLKPILPLKLREKTFQLLKTCEDNLITKQDLPIDMEIKKDYAARKVTIDITGIPDEIFPEKSFKIIKDTTNLLKVNKIQINIPDEFKFSNNSLSILNRFIKFTSAASGVALRNIEIKGRYIAELTEEKILETKILPLCNLERI